MKLIFKHDLELSTKLILSVLSYLILALWFAAQIGAGQESMRDQIRLLRDDVKTLTVRIDHHIDNERK